MKNKIISICTSIILTINAYGAMEISINEVSKKIEKISLEDQIVLKTFFRKLLCPFAYTLFGDKPISTECFELNKENPDILARPSSEGYKIWKKHAHLFPSNNFLFLFYEDVEDNYCEITLINKQAVQEIFEQHRTKFIDVLGRKMNAEKLLDLLIQKQSLWNTPLRHRDDLIGILLGFGKTNAELFQKRSEILGRVDVIKKKRTEPSPGYNSIDQELEALNTTFQVSNSGRKASLNYISLPGFAKDCNHPETQALMHKYKAQRKYITQCYSNGNILETTLQQLLYRDR